MEMLVASGLSGLAGLLELYAAHNRLGSRVAAEMAALSQLMVLDLAGNPCCQGPEYALHICYHMPALKASAPDHCPSSKWPHRPRQIKEQAPQRVVR